MTPFPTPSGPVCSGPLLSPFPGDTRDGDDTRNRMSGELTEGTARRPSPPLLLSPPAARSHSCPPAVAGPRLSETVPPDLPQGIRVSRPLQRCNWEARTRHGHRGHEERHDWWLGIACLSASSRGSGSHYVRQVCTISTSPSDGCCRDTTGGDSGPSSSPDPRP